MPARKSRRPASSRSLNSHFTTSNQLPPAADVLYRSKVRGPAAAGKIGAKYTGRHPGLIFEDLREMTLIGKSCGQSDFTKRLVGVGNFAGRELDPQAADVFANGATEMSAEKRREINR